MLPKFAPERVPRHHQEHGQARSIAVPRESHTHQPNWLKKPAPPTDRIIIGHASDIWQAVDVQAGAHRRRSQTQALRPRLVAEASSCVASQL